ncbi:CU044_5270 family protein [Actinomadura sp. 6N118]|uniref:CU044_5270 family protein n=1 Tax=Actinomadura sp. 6N118 TaxID=3375151 RepID=UPI0037A2A8EF
MTDPISRLSAVLPDALDETIDATYERRRDADLDRITSTPRAAVAHRTGRRYARPSFMILAAGAATAAIVAGATLIPGADGGEPRTSASTLATADAKQFLLASANIAAAAPATEGKYWHVRERYFEPVVKKGFTATVAVTRDEWFSTNRARIVNHQRPVVSFPTPADRQAWRRLGSPSLVPKAATVDYPKAADTLRVFGNPSYPAWRDVPADPAELERLVRRLQANPGDGDYRGHLFSLTAHALTQPAPPRVRAELFRMLARTGGIKVLQGARDRLGRVGTALYHRADSPPGNLQWMIIEPRRARLLALEEGGRLGDPANYASVYEAAEWTAELGAPVGRVTRVRD